MRSSVAAAVGALLALPHLAIGQCADGSPPPCQRRTPATLRAVAVGQPRLTATYDSVPLRSVIRELSALVHRTIIASSSAEATLISAYVKDQPWDEAFRAMTQARELEVTEDARGALTVRTSQETRNQRNQEVRTRVVATNRSATLLAELVRPTLASGVHLSVDSAGSRVIFSGPASLVDEAVGTLRSLDSIAAPKPPNEELYVGSTAEILAFATQQYRDRKPNSAIANLKNIISPTFLQSVRPDQRVTVLKYLGAAQADLSHADSAKVYFIAAMDFDPFVEVQAPDFAEPARMAFNAARTLTARLGVRPLPPAWVVAPDSAPTALVFKLVTTSPAQLKVVLINRNDTTAREALFEGVSDGRRDIAWRGQFGSGPAAAGVYVFKAEARFAGNREATEYLCFELAPRDSRRKTLVITPLDGRCRPQ